MQTFLEFEKPIAELEGKIEELRHLTDTGDINIAEPKALIGFAGPRVIEQTVREKLPEGFQRSEFLLEHGAIDQICDRRELRDRLSDLLAMLGRQPAPEVA